MDIAQLASPATTSLPIKLPNGDETDIVITGHTPDSDEWKRINKEVNGKPLDQELILRKDEQAMKLDPDLAEKTNKMMIRSVTRIDGMSENGVPFQSSPETIAKFFGNPAYQWILEQWRKHLDDRRNFFVVSEKTADNGSTVSPGLPPAMSESGLKSQSSALMDIG